jgi:ABC-type Fe3+ transport system permease subunit
MARKGKGFNPNGQAKSKAKSERIRKALSITQSVFVVGMAVILAGVVAPTVLHGIAGNGLGASDVSLHVFHAAGVTFFYTLESLGFAFLGALFGAMVVWAMAYPEIIGKIRLLRFVRRERELAPW